MAMSAQKLLPQVATIMTAIEASPGGGKETGYDPSDDLPVVRPRRSQEGNELTVEFTLLGRPFIGLNGGSAFQPNEAVSFMVLTANQEETDRYWDAIVGGGGSESDCGWCNDRWGFSWQITPKRLMELTTGSDRDKARRAMEAMLTMQRIDIARIEAAAD